MTFLTASVRAALGLGADAVTLRPARALSDGTTPPGVYLSLVNIREERTLRNLTHVERTPALTRYIEPPAHVNLDVLLAYNFSDYPTALTHLSATIELFQGHRFFDAAHPGPAGAAAFPAGLDRLILEMCNLGTEELNNLWGMLGASYLPSLVYRARLIEVRTDRSAPAQRIEEIATGTRISATAPPPPPPTP